MMRCPKKRSQLKDFYRCPCHFLGPRELYCASAISGYSIPWLAFCKRPNQKILKTHEMRTHLRCDAAPKSGPSTNQFSIGFSVVKCSKYNQFFHSRYKSVLKFVRFVLGQLFSPKMGSHFISFQYFLIRSFAKCQSWYRVSRNRTRAVQFPRTKKVARATWKNHKNLWVGTVFSGTSSHVPVK